MDSFALVIAGTSADSNCDNSQNQIYASLTYGSKCKNIFPAFIKPIQLKGKCDTFLFEWGKLCKTKPAKTVLVDSSRNKICSLPLENDSPYYFALPCEDIYYILKLREGSFIFVDEDPDVSSVRLQVTGKKGLKTNDVETREYLYVGDELLIDLIACNINCRKLYISVYEKDSCTPNPNISEFIVKPQCWPSCLGKKCNEYDGCGYVCGCPKDKVCNPSTGECVDPPPKPICNQYSACGSERGKCGGKCPPGKCCKRDINGIARCYSEERNPLSTAIILLIIILIILLLIYGGVSLINKYC